MTVALPEGAGVVVERDCGDAKGAKVGVESALDGGSAVAGSGVRAEETADGFPAAVVGGCHCASLWVGLLWQRAVLDEYRWVIGGVFGSFYIQSMPHLDVLGLWVSVM